MYNNLIKLPCGISEEVFIVEDYNRIYDVDKYMPIPTIYGRDIVIKPMLVEGFIINEDGVHIAEDGHDGWNKISTYHNLTLEKYCGCEVFYNLKDAWAFVETIIKK